MAFQSAIQSASKKASKHTDKKKKKNIHTLKHLGTGIKAQKDALRPGTCTYTSTQQKYTYMVTNMSSSYPINIKRKQAVVIRAPRLDGDNMPSMATTLSQTHTHTQTPLVISASLINSYYDDAFSGSSLMSYSQITMRIMQKS